MYSALKAHIGIILHAKQEKGTDKNVNQSTH